jgi:MFS family permease
VAGNSGREWQSHYTLPIIAALGYATSVIHIYGLGPYIKPISDSFGWKTADVTIGLLISTLLQASMAVPIGRLVDKHGSRTLALIGVISTCLAVALLGTATGSKANWILLWLVIAFASLPVQATIWMTAVASRFKASRGMALAVTLCGASIAQFSFPWIATKLIAGFGWQKAFALHALGWAALIWPLLFFLFRGGNDAAKGAPSKGPAAVAYDGPPPLTIWQGLRSSIYTRMLVVSLLLTFIMVGLNVNFTLVLTGSGIAKLRAAEIAGMIGIFSLIGRLGAGFLLDRFSAARIGGVMFLLPAIGIGLLIFDVSQTNALIAAALIGLALGSEIDVIAYLVTRHFGLSSFGTLYGGMLAALSVGTAVGPYIANQILDETGSFDLFLKIGLACMVISSLLTFSLPAPEED